MKPKSRADLLRERLEWIKAELAKEGGSASTACDPDEVQHEAHDLIVEWRKSRVQRAAIIKARVGVAARLYEATKNPRRAVLLTAAVFDAMDDGERGDLRATLERLGMADI